MNITEKLYQREMSRRMRYIDNKPVELVRDGARNGSEDDLASDSYDSALFETIGDYMKGRLDIDDVKNDPSFSNTSDKVKGMISDYDKNSSGNKENRKFINEILSGAESEKKLAKEIFFIKQEIDDKNLKKITSEWVKEWHEKKQKIGVSDPKRDEISNFIKGAINSSTGEPDKIQGDIRKKGSGSSPFLKYASLAAAALIGVFMIIRTLLPSSDPEKLFNSFYKPFYAVSPLTRSMNNNISDSYSSAIGSYKKGDYKLAAAGFTSVSEKDPSLITPRFFLGLSQIALANYEQAIDLLRGVADDAGEYGKEARWYLGLSYLKTGNEKKAAECFEYLSKSNGFYRERSEKILRRLK